MSDSDGVNHLEAALAGCYRIRRELARKEKFGK